MEFLPQGYDSDSDSDVEEYVGLQPTNDQNMTLSEKFDPHKLNYILKNEDTFKKEMRPECFADDYNPFAIMRKYLAASKNGEIEVKYKQNLGIGRFYSQGSLSLQNMPREVRHTIAGRYCDIDMVNAHPVILQHLCSLRGITCKYLTRYNKDREKYLTELKVDRDIGKTAILSLMNGGCKDYDNLPTKTTWITKFKREIVGIHRQFSACDGYINHRDRRISEGKLYNHEASYMNVLLCDFENKILQCMWEDLGSPTDAVLCFDGIMVVDGEYDLRGVEAAVLEELGIKIELKVKPMDEGFTLPDTIPQYKDTEYNRFDFTDTYSFHEFRQEFNSSRHESYAALDDAVREKFMKVVALVTVGEGMFVKKGTDGHDVVRKLGCSNFNMFYKNEKKKTKISFQDYLMAGTHSFGEMCCNLDPNTNKSHFNTWSGFQAQRVTDPSPEALAGVELMKSFILESWAAGDVENYRYIISWIAGLFGTDINKKALAMISPQGCGKGTLIEFLELLLRKTNVYNTVGINSITQKHNTAIQGKRLVVINEMSATRDEFKSNFDKIKSYITDPTISIEPKGVNPYQVDNISNYVLFTNHRDAIIVEESDRRYAIFEMSDSHKNDDNYFGEIRSKCFNQDVADAFYTFLLDTDRVPLGKIPNTALRKEMMALSRSSPLKYVEYAIGEGRGEEEDEVSGTVFYSRYVDWCKSNGEKSISSTKFGLNMNGVLSKKRTNRGMMYVLPAIVE